MRRKEGFTLVELLIVLAVIAALLATITPVALNAVKRAKASQVAQNLRNIRTAVEQYVYTEQELPNSIDDLSNYLSKIPGNYEMVATDTDFTDGDASILVYYTSDDVQADEVNKIYPEATSGVSTSTYGVTDFKFGVEFAVRKYW